MYPKLNAEPVGFFINNRKLKIPREKIAAAYAGAWAAKECILWNSNPLLCGFTPTFKEKYNELFPACINAANNVGLSVVPETLDYWNPAKGTDELLKDRIEHSDNPCYPFFEED